MNEKSRKKSLGKTLTAIAAAFAVGLGVTLSGCGPEEFEPPEAPEEEVPLPGEPAPAPEAPEEAPEAPQEDQ